MNHRNHDHEQQHQQEPATASGKAGWMSKDEQRQAVIVVGQIIRTNLYSRGVGVVVNIRGEQAPSSCSGIGGVVRFGGRAEFDIAFASGWSRRLPEAILRGVQWEISHEVLSPSDVLAATFRADEVEEEKRVAAASAEAEFALRLAQMRTGVEYPFLIQADDNLRGGSQLAAKNIRIHLKRAFPGVKFSVRSGGNATRVGWTDGPTVADVEAITGMYEAGSFDSMTDCYNYIRNPFTEVYGSNRYVTTSRELSAEMVDYAIAYAYKHEDEDGQMPARPTAEDYMRGRLWSVPVFSHIPRVNTLAELIGEIASRTRGGRDGFVMTENPDD